MTYEEFKMHIDFTEEENTPIQQLIDEAKSRWIK